MLRLMKNELNKLKLPVILTVVVLTVGAIILSCTLYENYSNIYTDLDAWEIGGEIINFLFPLFVVVPICWSMYYERKNNFLLYTMPRMSKAKYIKAKWAASAISAFTIIFIPYFLSAIFALYVKPPITPYTDNMLNHVFLDLYVGSPLLYALLLCLWKSIIGVLVMSFGFMLSLYVKNIFVILTAPFIYSVLENFTWAILRLPQYRLVTSFEPTAISEDMVSLVSSAVGPALLILCILIIWLYFAKVKRKTVYEV